MEVVVGTLRHRVTYKILLLGPQKSGEVIHSWEETLVDNVLLSDPVNSDPHASKTCVTWPILSSNAFKNTQRSVGSSTRIITG